MLDWTLHCSTCSWTGPADVLSSLCPLCHQPLFADYTQRGAVPRPVDGAWSYWRYRDLLPVMPGEVPVSLGEGLTPMIAAPTLAKSLGIGALWIKDEGQNPTASFKARGMAAALTRAKALGVPGVVVPTAGNAGAALAAYARAAGVPARVYAPATTPPPILATVRAMSIELILVDGHIGDAGKLAMAYAKEHGWFNIATLREPYRVEGMKTMGFELAEQLGWRLPDVVMYPTGGGEGTIGIWKAFAEMKRVGWIDAKARMPKMAIAQAAGCAPLVRAFAAHESAATAWENPVTSAAGLRVPSPLGDRLVLRTLAESGGAAYAVSEEVMADATLRLSAATGVDAAPEGGCALAALEQMRADGQLDSTSEVVLFNTGAGASYRW